MPNHNMSNLMSEATEMYLLRISLLSQQNDPVPISQLAETLEVSPISANQMCRKLEVKGFVSYQPYKGVTLTPQGKAVALRVLRKRRLWEVFLAEKLGVSPDDAEEIACRLEHATPVDIAEKLADFLRNPRFSPQRQPIPPRDADSRRNEGQPLAALSVGQHARITAISADDALNAFLRHQDIKPGAEVMILAIAEQAMLLHAGGQRITLHADIARQIDVITLTITP